MCNKSTKKLTTTIFIERAIKVHGYKYDYSNSKYINNRTKISIFCDMHGEFFQLPSTHMKGQGCNKCGNIKISENVKLTTSEFIEKANIIHNNIYDYSKSKYINSRYEIIIICKTHGEFTKKAGRHLEGVGCNKCGEIIKIQKTTKNTEYFINKAAEIHSNFYDYSKVNYTNNKAKVTIKCPTHNEFQQVASLHLLGSGCPKCAAENKTGYTKEKWVEKNKNKICIFYILKCFNDQEEFYKIGITARNIKKRYANTISMPYSYEIVSEIKGSADFIWDLESQEKRKLKEFSYKPYIKFCGSKTECFTQYETESKSICS